MRAAALFALAVLALGACTTVTEVDEGPYFTEGFSDGCRTAEARRAAFDTRSFRNDELFQNQPSYAAGWREGFANCQRTGIGGPQPTSTGAVEPIL
ncbi:hypothetical protein HK107_09790 [Parvularcula sp. ZS-1/3]|uniref:Lipoprotein n=1 Tax=Parvularcula mediterranea TaxID=2732508 RepID=A0A7Y3W5T7_9PROT|nr:hypothetical protein [Parvularcula mediterranea]NNU16611.1 hypothetical protein [Parvularcula mediterranea]